jgi:glycerophosphoryl diester phosphodiesterase
LVALLLLCAPLGAAAQIPLLDGNPWLERRVLNIAHRGAAHDAPENTLFAYRTSLDNGADMLEMDVFQTADGELVAIHDDTVNRTTNGSGAISDLTLAEIQALDAAYWYVEGRGAVRGEDADAYIYRGIATGQREMPDELAAAGFSPSDFRIPTVREVLESFPGVWKVIELKPDLEGLGSYEAQLAGLLREFGRADDVIVASFVDVNLELFKLAAPEIHTSYPLGQAGVHWATSQGPLPGVPNRHVALQVPMEFEVIPVVNEQFVADAHAMDVAVHVWTINDCQEMVDLLHMGVDGIMTDRSVMLAELLTQPEGQWDCGLLGAQAAGEAVELEVEEDGEGEDTSGVSAPSPESPSLPATGADGGGLMAMLVAKGALALRTALHWRYQIR